MDHKQKWHVSFPGGGFEELMCPSSSLFPWRGNLGNYMLIFSGMGGRQLGSLCNRIKKRAPINEHKILYELEINICCDKPLRFEGSLLKYGLTQTKSRTLEPRERQQMRLLGAHTPWIELTQWQWTLDRHLTSPKGYWKYSSTYVTLKDYTLGYLELGLSICILGKKKLLKKMINWVCWL